MRLKLLLLFSLLSASIGAQTEKTLNCAWYPWNPYQYIDETNELTGLDCALISRIFEESGIKVVYDESSIDTWTKNQLDVLEGKADITAGAFSTAERLKNYHVSEPYRYEWNALYIKRDNETLEKFESIEDLIPFIEQNKIRVGVIEDYTYTSTDINQFIDRQKKLGAPLLLEASVEGENFQNLMEDSVDIVVSDRLVGAQIIWKNQWGLELMEHQVSLPAKPIHLLIHKSEDPQINAIYKSHLEKFNSSLSSLKEEGVIDDIIAEYLFPVLLNITVQTDWFHAIDIIGVVFFALAGLLIAKDNKLDLFGVFSMSLFLSAGGGILRDLIVDRPLAFFQDPQYLRLVMLIAIVGFLIFYVHIRLLKRFSGYARVCQLHQNKWDYARVLVEAVALGAYVVVGVGVAIEAQLDPLLVWGPLLGCITSCGGGIIATVFTRKETGVFKGGLDPFIALAWGAFFSYYMMWQTDRLNPDEVFVGVIITIVGTTVTVLVTRLLKAKALLIQS